MMDVATRFGENLRRVRKGVGISQEELGFRSSLHRTEIGLLERGARVPRIDTLIKIASGLGIRIDLPPGGHQLDPGQANDASGRLHVHLSCQEHAGLMERGAAPTAPRSTSRFLNLCAWAGDQVTSD